jgi:hypothetical protein
MYLSRGSLWRGKDCHDGDPDVHPGRRPADGDRCFASCVVVSGSAFY